MKKIIIVLSLSLFLPVIAMQREENKTLVTQNNKESSQEKRPYIEIFFTSKDDVQGIICKKISESKGKIWACSFLFNSDKISNGWVTARNRKGYENLSNPKFTQEDMLIIDKENLKTFHLTSNAIAVLKNLINSGVKVVVREKPRRNGQYEIMHNKFLIFFDSENKNGELAINGSFNLTNQANQNWENIIVTNDQGVIQKLIVEFKDLLPYCVNIKEAKFT
jgi:phosphatidylserine/phosphatidylglycerophosphate/cardiolipin synthase-like enzyme